jgi:hypothetical protein
VWLARPRLPALLVPAYLGVGIAITLARTHSADALRAWAAGFWEGIRTSCGLRHPMHWRTVWRMTRLGRPPLVCLTVTPAFLIVARSSCKNRTPGLSSR